MHIYDIYIDTFKLICILYWFLSSIGFNETVSFMFKVYISNVQISLAHVR